jgi:hypothetical protein
MWRVWGRRELSPPKPCIRLSLPIRATCPAHFILLDFITRIIVDEQYRSLSSSLWSLFQSPVTSSLLDPNNLLKNVIIIKHIIIIIIIISRRRTRRIAATFFS